MEVKLWQCTHLEPNISGDWFIEYAGRICYPDSQDKMTATGSPKFIKMLIDKGHTSVLEHGYASFEIRGISRACSHQLVRHRIASYSQRSQRYCPEDKFDYVVPPSLEGKTDPLHKIPTEIVFKNAMEDIRLAYVNLRAAGVKPEDARMVLPNACETVLIMSCNFRSLRNFFELRCDKHAQWEIRALANRMLELVYEKVPACFEDLYDKYIRKNNNA